MSVWASLRVVSGVSSGSAGSIGAPSVCPISRRRSTLTVSTRPRASISSSSWRARCDSLRDTSLGGSSPASTRLRTSSSDCSALSSDAASTRTASLAVTSAQ